MTRPRPRRQPPSIQPRIRHQRKTFPPKPGRNRRGRNRLPTWPMTLPKHRQPMRPLLPADPAVDPAPVSEPTSVEPAPTDTAALESKVETIGAATPVPVAPASETPVDAAAEPAPEPSSTPSPTPAPEPVGPASVTVDAPIRAGPSPDFDLIFTVPMGSTVEQTGHVTDGYVTVQYKEVTGWLALEQLGTASSYVAETPPAETATPVEPAPAEASPVAHGAGRPSRSRPSRSRSTRRAPAQASPSRRST